MKRTTQQKIMAILALLMAALMVLPMIANVFLI